MSRKVFMISVLLWGVLSFTSWADLVRAEYPDKKIRLIVAVEPGGLSDIMTRTLARYVNPYLGGNVYVENIPGAGSAIGWRAAAKSKPDGYNLAYISTGIMVNPNITKDFPTLDLFDPICVVMQDTLVLTIKPDGRFRRATDLISYAKVHPGDVTVGIAGGVGGPHHLMILALADAAGAKFAIVPYKGDAPTLVAAMGGHIDISAASCSGSKTYVEGKKLLPLVVSGAERSRLYPDVPTVKELGYDVVVYIWGGVGVPKGTPKEVKDILVEAFRKATEDEGYKKLMDEMALKQIFLDPEKAGPWLKAQNTFFKNMATKIGLKPE